MARGDAGGEIAALSRRKRDFFSFANGFSGFSRQEALDYAGNMIDCSGARPGEIIILRVTNEEQIDVAPVFLEAAKIRGLEPPRILPPDGVMSDEELAETMRMQEERWAGGGVEITLRPLAGGTPLYGHDDYFSMEDGFNPRRQELQDILDRARDRAALDRMRRYNISLWPNKAWAHKVFPDAGREAERELAKLLSRVTFTGDPEGLARHIEKIEKRKHQVNDLLQDGFSFVEVSSPPDPLHSHPLNRGTSLRMEIAPQSQFISASFTTSAGQEMIMNNPSDEVWGTPLRSSVSGYFTTTRPYVTPDEEGKIVAVEGIYGEFKDGKLVQLKSFDPRHQYLLDRDFNKDDDPPTDVLGELGLVDSSGPLAQAKGPDGRPRTFFDNLLDENAGLHIGFGKSYQNNTGGVGDIAPVTGSSHRDLIIGNEKTTVSFLNPQGNRKTVIDRGLWQDDEDEKG